MRFRIIPGRAAIAGLGILSAAALVALLIGATVTVVAWAALLAVAILDAVTVWDALASRRAWRPASPAMTRRLPAAFAIGAKRSLELALDVEGTRAWRCELYDHADPSVLTQGLPVSLTLAGGPRTPTPYPV